MAAAQEEAALEYEEQNWSEMFLQFSFGAVAVKLVLSWTL